MVLFVMCKDKKILNKQDTKEQERKQRLDKITCSNAADQQKTLTKDLGNTYLIFLV